MTRNPTNRSTTADAADAADAAERGVSRRGLLRTAGVVGLGGTAAALLVPGGSAEASTPTVAATAGTLPVNTGPAPTPATPPAPLFDDPLYSGASDPTIVFNRTTNEWWMLYTQRRAFDSSGGGVAWVHGSDIGLASSADGGVTWLYRGVAQGLAYEPGKNTYWAPEVIWNAGTYHMFVAFIRGIPNTWTWNRNLIHYTSKDLLNWHLVGEVRLESDKVIDACIYPLPANSRGLPTWRMWYKDEANGSHIYAAESHNLHDWDVVGPVITNHGQEGPQVFELGGTYWMITDPDATGLLVYSSPDLLTWTAQDAPILADQGTRKDDNSTGHHCFVMTQKDIAHIVYFTQFGRTTYIQVAPLSVIAGVMTVDRNTPFQMAWLPRLATTLRGGNQTTPTP